jgi:hypothetical protein
MKNGIHIKQENLFFLNGETIRIEIGQKQIFDKDKYPVLEFNPATGKAEPTFTKGKVFLIQQIPIGKYLYFTQKLSMLMFALSGLFGSEEFILKEEPLKINEKLIMKYSGNKLLLKVCYELLKECGYKRKFYYEMFRINETDNMFSALLKQPLKLLFWLLNKAQEKICFRMSFNYFVDNVYSQDLVAIFFGVLLINVEGPKKKVKEMAEAMTKFSGVRPLSMQTLFQGYRPEGNKGYISRTGKDGYMELVTTKT